MSWLDDSSSPDQFQDSGGLLGRLSSLSSQLGAGLQGWAQTPAGNPFAGLANGITAFNNAQPPDGSFIGPPAPTSTTQPQDFGDRLGAAFQGWAQTPVGNPFAALANGINAFNGGQVNTPGGGSAAMPAPTQAQNVNAPPNTGFQGVPMQPSAYPTPRAPVPWLPAKRSVIPGWPLR